MDGRLPLAALLSHLLVAFIIEFDNEFEHRVPHRTTNHGGSSDAPWLASMAMWSRFMRFVPDDGIPVRELERLLGIKRQAMQAWLTRLGTWWGYVLVEGAVVRPTGGGRAAQAVWRPLTGIIEQHWRERFGEDEIAHLGASLRAVADQLDADLPDSLPILGYGLFSRGTGREGASNHTLPALLSKLLLAFAIEFERDSEVSLAISANVLRLAGEAEVRLRDLPRLAGISKEAIAMALSFLKKRGYATTAKVLALTAKGRQAQSAYHERVAAIEAEWLARFGKSAMRSLRESLEHFEMPLLFRGLEPYADGWRASLPRPDVLPHYPMILHRGGFPDGS